MIRYVIFDWKRTLYDPDEKALIDGALDILMYLQKKDIPLVLIGKGGEDMYQEVERLGVKPYFTKIIFQEGKKDVNLYTPYINTESPQETLFIGDRVRSELAVGNSIGATTIWVKQGKFANEEPEQESQKPTYTIGTLNEALKVVQSL